ncbi:MAG TPA: hypothetical protein VFK56_10185 [Mycobacterium sp.]|nr:hypothetical protein [Mycobacterium sp.]
MLLPVSRTRDDLVATMAVDILVSAGTPEPVALQLNLMSLSDTSTMT